MEYTVAWKWCWDIKYTFSEIDLFRWLLQAHLWLVSSGCCEILWSHREDWTIKAHHRVNPGKDHSASLVLTDLWDASELWLTPGQLIWSTWLIHLSYPPQFWLFRWSKWLAGQQYPPQRKARSSFLGGEKKNVNIKEASWKTFFITPLIPWRLLKSIDTQDLSFAEGTLATWGFDPGEFLGLLNDVTGEKWCLNTPLHS